MAKRKEGKNRRKTKKGAASRRRETSILEKAEERRRPPTIAGKNAAAKKASDSEPRCNHGEGISVLTANFTYSRWRKDHVRSRVSSRRRVDNGIFPERRAYVRSLRVTGHL